MPHFSRTRRSRLDQELAALPRCEQFPVLIIGETVQGYNHRVVALQKEAQNHGGTDRLRPGKMPALKTQPLPANWDLACTATLPRSVTPTRKADITRDEQFRPSDLGVPAAGQRIGLGRGRCSVRARVQGRYHRTALDTRPVDAEYSAFSQ